MDALLPCPDQPATPSRSGLGISHLGFLLNFVAKPAELADPVSVAIPGAGLVIDDAVTVGDPLESPSATFHGRAEAFVRLISGRLKAPYDHGVTVTGSITLDDLRRVFPGL